VSTRNIDWKTLETRLNTWLKEIALKCNLHYRGSNESIYGTPNDCFKSDGMITDGEIMIAIEIERGQYHPDTNVGKYWFIYDRLYRYKKMILIHVYTPLYESFPWRKELASFYASKMINYGNPLEYVELDYRNKTVDSNTVFNEITKLIERYLTAYKMCKH